MNLRDGLKVNTSKEIRTNRQTRKEKREKREREKEKEKRREEKRFLKQNNQHLANKLSHTMLDFKACYAIVFHFPNCLVIASGYIKFNVQIKQI